MALMQCTECSNQVSSLAAACPQCGAPVAGMSQAIASGAPIVTTQATAKKFKGHMLIGAALFIVGVSMVFGHHEPDEMWKIQLGSWMSFIGIIWFITARARAWWNNG